jgi:hypothetical protein
MALFPGEQGLKHPSYPALPLAPVHCFFTVRYKALAPDRFWKG